MMDTIGQLVVIFLALYGASSLCQDLLKINAFRRKRRRAAGLNALLAQRIEHEPSKLGVEGSNPSERTNELQPIERPTEPK
jgi:hypothetical protein